MCRLFASQRIGLDWTGIVLLGKASQRMLAELFDEHPLKPGRCAESYRLQLTYGLSSACNAVIHGCIDDGTLPVDGDQTRVEPTKLKPHISANDTVPLSVRPRFGAVW